jgi:predicted ribosome quality control (RQC) complex YloA/Tae2 family protein
MPMVKKDFTSFDLFASVSELQGKLIDSRVNNVYQLDSKTILLKLHKTAEPPMRLIMEAGRRLHLTNYSQEKPQTPPAFCMTLRKYLPGAWIKRLEQHEFERIVTFHFQSKMGTLRLVLELFGEGNIILVDETNKILQALFFKRMRDRNIVRGEPYQFPPSAGKNPFNVTQDELEAGLKSAGDAQVVRTVVRFLGFGGTYGEELLLRAEIDKSKPCSQLNHEEIEAIFNALQELLLSLEKEKRNPNIVLDERDAFLDVLPFKLRRYDRLKFQFYSTFSEALDEFYVRVTTAEKALAGIDIGQFQREGERLRRMKSEQEQALCEDKRKMEHDKIVGDMIYSHFSELQSLLERFSSVWREGRDLNIINEEVLSKKKAGCVPENFFASFDSRGLVINITIGDFTFGLSLRKSLYENAAIYYDKSKKAKQKMAGVLAALEDSCKKLAEIEKRLGEVEALKSTAPEEALEELASRRIATKEWFEKFRWFNSSEGFLVVAGKDVVSNEVLIKKYTEPYDLVFHADIVGSPFAVVKTEGKEPGEQTLLETGEFAAAFSRAWREGMGAADVYWVKPEQLSKSGPSGEFVPHGAFAVTGKRNWLRGTPLRVAVGIAEDEISQFVGGPVEAVKAKTKNYIVLVPGEFAGKDLLKSILRSLVLKLPRDQRERMGKASIEAIREFVPYTKARILTNP